MSPELRGSEMKLRGVLVMEVMHSSRKLLPRSPRGHLSVQIVGRKFSLPQLN